MIRVGSSLERLDLPVDCAECVFERGALAPDGSILASFMNNERAYLYRRVDDEWERVAMPASLAGRHLAGLQADEKGVWMVFGGKGHRVGHWSKAGWRVLPDEAMRLDRPRGRWSKNRADPVEIALGRDGTVHVLRERSIEDLRASRPAVETPDGLGVGFSFPDDAEFEHAVHRDGEWITSPPLSAPGMLGLPKAQLALRDGREPVIALPAVQGIWVFERHEDGWRPLSDSESGFAWDGYTESVDLGTDRQGRVCVAFTAVSLRHRRLGVLCHPGGR